MSSLFMRASAPGVERIDRCTGKKWSPTLSSRYDNRWQAVRNVSSYDKSQTTRIVLLVWVVPLDLDDWILFAHQAINLIHDLMSKVHFVNGADDGGNPS